MWQLSLSKKVFCHLPTKSKRLASTAETSSAFLSLFLVHFTTPLVEHHYYR